uniref:LRRCT domain-containing protein n=1 Tax=Branchiostoma floridae TaxID=7739 RepID=C3ZTF6_BRAFL|eukprot:XP_002588192.1 hypothetical protein BRAFLDRAFT_68834 [Branchiostoma floridae]
MHWDWLNRAPRLQNLDLSQNRIVHVSGRFDAHLVPNIFTINLSFNRITSFRKEAFLFPTCGYAIMYIDGNPVHCDQDLCWLYHELRCLSQCFQPCGMHDVDVPVPVFRDCCHNCPSSTLYFLLLWRHDKLICASPKHVEGQQVNGVLKGLCESTSEQNRGLIREREMTTSNYTYELVNTTQVTLAIQSALPTNSTLNNSVSTVQWKQKKVQTNTGKHFFAATSVFLFVTVLSTLLLRARQCRYQHRQPKPIDQVLRDGQALIQNQMYGTTPHQVGSQETTRSQEGIERIEPYEETSLAKIAEDQALHASHEEHSYACINDDVYSVRQIVEATWEHQYCNEVGRYERVPNELGCTGVEPYAEISLSNIAEEGVTVQVDVHSGEDNPDCHETDAELIPHPVSALPGTCEETNSLQTLGETGEQQDSDQGETDPKVTRLPVLGTNNDEMPGMTDSNNTASNTGAGAANIQTNNKVLSASNEKVYQQTDEGQESRAKLVGLLTKNSTSVQNTSLIREREMTTSNYTYELVNTTQVTLAIHSALPTNSTLDNSVSTVQWKQKKVQTNTGKHFFAATSAFLFVIVLWTLLLRARQCRYQRRQPKPIDQVLRGGQALIQNQMYGTTPHQVGSQETTRSQEGSERIEPYEETSLAKIAEDQALHASHEEHSYACINDDVHSVRQIVEATWEHQYCNEVSRYERVPNELGCTGVEPYAEISLSNIAEGGVTVQVDVHSGEDNPDCHGTDAEPSPHPVSALPGTCEETNSLQTLGETDEQQDSDQGETDPKVTRLPVLGTNNDIMPGMIDSNNTASNTGAGVANVQTNNKVLSASNEKVYQQGEQDQESRAKLLGLLNKSEVVSASNETVYQNETHVQQSTSRDAELLSEENLKDSKNTVNCTYSAT